MYINDLGVKEINQYYAQHGGRRTALIKGFANYMENAKTGRISAHANFASAASAADTGNSVKTGINTLAARQTASGTTAQATWRAASGAASQAARQTTTGTTAQTARQATSKAQSDTEGTDNSTAGASGNGDTCCDKCQLTQQLMLRMMTNNLYTQSGLGYSAMGSGALAAYQSLSKYFGTGLFS